LAALASGEWVSRAEVTATTRRLSRLTCCASAAGTSDAGSQLRRRDQNRRRNRDKCEARTASAATLASIAAAATRAAATAGTGSRASASATLRARPSLSDCTCCRPPAVAGQRTG